MRLLLVALVAAGAAYGWREFRRFRQRRMIEHARQLIDQQQYNQAALSVGRALQLNTHDVVANRMMAEIADAAESKQALYWRRAVAELEPGIVENRFKWAEAALHFNEPAAAAQALKGVNEAGTKKPMFHDLAGQVAQAGGQGADAVRHFTEAVAMEPGNELFQFHLAAARLMSATPDGRAALRAEVEKHLANPQTQRLAERALLGDAMRNKDWQAALSLAEQVQKDLNTPFSDRMIYLGLLRSLKQPAFYGHLQEMQDRALAKPDDLAALITWMGENVMALVAVDWTKRLPDKLMSQMPVPAAIGECYAVLHDWKTLRDLVTDTNWEYVEFLRLAFLARVQRENGEATQSKNSWNAATLAAAEHPEQLIMLARYGSIWGWETETDDLLWVAARGTTNQQWALNALLQAYSAKGSARRILNVAVRMTEIDPHDLTSQNNVALLSLLLNTSMERAENLATELYKKAPENPGIVSTYAYAQHLQGKTEEAVKLMRALGEKQLEDPSYAAYFGVLLVDSSSFAEAKKYLDIAATAKLLPEEMALIANARERLLKRETPQ